MSSIKTKTVAKPAVKRGRIKEPVPVKNDLVEAAKKAGALLQANETWHDAPPKKLYKFLRTDGRTPQQNFLWPLPKGDKPGEWLEVKGQLRTCRNGLHLTDEENAGDWVSDRVYEVEVEGGVLASSQKYVARKVRLVREVPGWREALADARKARKAPTRDNYYSMPTKATKTTTDWDRYLPLLVKAIKGAEPHSSHTTGLIEALKATTTADEGLKAVTEIRDKVLDIGKKAKIANLEAEIAYLRGRGKVKPKSTPVPRPDTLLSLVVRSGVKPTVEHYAILKGGGSFHKSWYAGFEWSRGNAGGMTINKIAAEELRRLEPPKPVKPPTPTKKPAPKLPAGLAEAARRYAH